MKMSRELALKFHFVLEQCIPPILRDSKLAMALPFRLLYKDKSSIFLSFKDKARSMSEDEFSQTYREIESVIPERDTDLTEDCMARILASISGEAVLEAGCGRGVLAGKLAQTYQVTAVDMVIGPDLEAKHPG